MKDFKIKIFSWNPFPIEYQSETASGIDLPIPLKSLIPARGEVIHIPLQFSIEVPPGYEGQIRLRSSMGKLGLIIPNAPGTIDSDYRGEVGILLANIGIFNHYLEAGQRVAQLIICPVQRSKIEHVSKLSDLSYTERGKKGFGSTGTH
jgi:dUTP pyrophosphatase